jgi:hypothetical protein
MPAVIVSLLRSIYCIPCIWSVIGILGVVGIGSYYLNVWVPFRGPLPSDGPVEGFASKAARIEYYDTRPLRVRTAFKAGAIVAGIWLVGLVTAFVILTNLGGAA